MIYGRSGSGKTTELFKRLRESLARDDDFRRKRYVIVPDQFSYMMEKKLLHEFGERYMLTVQVVGFRTLSQRVLERVGGIRRPLLSPVGRSMLISSQALKHREELTLYRKSASFAGFADMVAQTIRELKNYRVTPEELKAQAGELPESELKKKLADISLLYGAYQEELKKNFVDAEDQLDTAIEQLQRSSFLSGAEFYLDEFSDFTLQQLGMLEVLLTKGDVYITLSLEEGLDDQYNGVFSLTRDTDRALMELVRRSSVSLARPVFLEGSGRFAQNPELAFLERQFYHYPNEEYQEGIRTIALYRAQNPYEEMEYVARDILRRVREQGYRFRDLAILLRDLDTYGAVLKSVMAQYGIPVFIDSRKEIDSNPLAAFMAGFFEIRRSNFQSEAVFKFLKTRLLDLTSEEIDLLENYCLANGITGWKWQQEYWKYPVPDVQDELKANRIEAALNEIRHEIVVQPLLVAFQALEEAGSVRDKARAFYEYLVAGGVLQRFGGWIEEFSTTDAELHREYSQIQDSLITVLDQMVEAMGDEAMSVEDFGNTLLVGLSSVKISLIPATLDQVIVGDIARVRSGGVRGIYIVGANDGVLPRAPASQGIFTDSDREKLAAGDLILSKDSRTRAFYEQFYVYNALTIGQDFLTVTYPTADAEGKSLRPSMIVGRLKKLFPKLKEEVSQSYLEQGSPGRDDISSEREAFRQLIGEMRRQKEGLPVDPVWKEVYARFKASPAFQDRLTTVEEGLRFTNSPKELKAAHMDELYGKNLTLTVSKLERYNQCPFAYFVRYGLKAEKRKEYIMDTPDMGILVHDVLDGFTKRLQTDRLDWKDVTPGYTRQAVDELMARSLDEKENHILRSSRRYGHMAGKIRRIITSSVGVIQDQILRGAYEPLYSEIDFGPGAAIPPVILDIDEEHSVSLKGRIDRVDVLRDHDRNYIRIIDYKTGMKELTLNDIVHGLQMQLLVYLDVILRNSDKILKGQTLPGAVLYFIVKRPIIENGALMSDEMLEDRVLHELKLKGLILEDARIVRSMDRDMADISLVIPAKIKDETVTGVGNVKDLIISEEQFDQLRDHVTRTIRSVCTNLIQGDISITPVKQGDQTACQYCDYRSICQFDPSQKGNEYNRIRKLDSDEAWLMISEGGSTNADLD